MQLLITNTENTARQFLGFCEHFNARYYSPDKPVEQKYRSFAFNSYIATELHKPFIFIMPGVKLQLKCCRSNHYRNKPGYHTYIVQGKSREPVLQSLPTGPSPTSLYSFSPWLPFPRVGSTAAPVCGMAAEATIVRAAKVSINTTFAE